MAEKRDEKGKGMGRGWTGEIVKRGKQKEEKGGRQERREEV